MKKTIDETDRLKFISFVVEEIRCRGNNCTLTHIQKACYLAKNMLGVDIGYKFVPYRFGPYCQELADDIEEASSRCVLLNYGDFRPSLPVRRYIDDNKADYLYIDQINYIADWFKFKGATDVGILASAHMMVFDPKHSVKSESEQIKKLVQWKPHFGKVAIKSAIKIVKEKQKEADAKFPSTISNKK